MSINTAIEILNTIVLGGWAGFGMICGLRWWQERKARAEASRAEASRAEASRAFRAFRQAVNQISVNHLTAAKSQAWEEGFTKGAAYYHESGKEPAAFTETATSLNPYKDQTRKDSA
ncbi:hypothetical protein [Rothia nasimurium]|uniref:hypothetical protein n=1 Tax=Rothia nasimurium TaxID=85336 RepID=UPI001F220BDF|nr:hypothetical protein [Rothia nasimurium]